jgi:hypothetical protein
MKPASASNSDHFENSTLNSNVKTNSKFPVDAGFPCSKVPVIATLQGHDKMNTVACSLVLSSALQDECQNNTLK